MTEMLAGTRPLLAKETRDWWRRRAAQTTLIAVSFLAAVGTLATRIDEMAGGVPNAAQLIPTANVLGSKLDQWVVLAAIFGSLGLVTTERASGTLAWTLSQPVGRPAFLLAKWVAAIVVFAVTAVVIPLAVSAGVATVAYGSPPDLVTVATFGLLLIAVTASFVALELALATALDSQAAIAAISFAVFAAPYLLGSLVPALAIWWPTSLAATAGPVALGEPIPVATVIGWLAGLLICSLGGSTLLSRRDI
jgi:ABC-2 type transport system permease protein